VGREGCGGRPAEQRFDVDPRFRLVPAFLYRREPRRPVRRDRSRIVPGNVQSQPPESFVPQNRRKRGEDSPADAAPDVLRVEHDADVAGRLARRPHHERSDHRRTGQRRIGPAYLGHARKRAPERVALARVERANVVVPEERVRVLAPAGERVDVLTPHRTDCNDLFLPHVVRDMRTIARSLAGTIAGLLLFGPAAAGADPTDRCTHESWSIDGSPLAAVFCVPAAPGTPIVVSETFTRNGASFSRSLDLVLVSGADVARAIDTVPLDAVGSAKQLHLTVAYRNGRADVEHALLLPGAVVLK
jgi:hypothetical protein